MRQKGLRTAVRVIVFLPAVFFWLLPATAQTERVRDDNANGWYMFFGDHKLTPKWGAHTELQWRRHNVITDPQQLLLRLGANYYLSDGAMVTLGYGFIETYPYGDFPAAHSFPEQRIYQQLQLQGGVGRVGLTHRYRLEQRWVELPGSSECIYLNRARYMLRGVFPLAGRTLEAKEPYLAAYDEIFVGFGNNVPNNFDQNRLYSAVGYKLNREGALEVGYLYQVVQQRNRRVFEHNHTLQIGLTYNLDFTR
jgi:hypothetical protein